MTICSYNNSGEIKYDVDIEMAQGYWNTSASRLWTKIRDNFHNELVAMYAKMRANGLSYESLMSYFYGQQISKIPETYYNKDADTKYLPFADQYMGMAHGNGYEHLKRWLKNRLIFTDTLYDYAPSYNNDVLTIRANTTEPMTITIETYTPVYQHLSWYNNQMDKKKIDGKTAITFTGTAQTATDQEVLIYGGSNIKRITGISSMNPNSMLIGSATRLIELDVSNCPILATVNATGSNFTPHTYLNKLDISNCPNLTGTLRINNSPLLRELNAKGTGIDTLQLAPSLRNLEVLRLPNTVTELTLNDAGLLNTLEFDEGGNLQRISLSNCPGIANSNIDLTKVPSVSLDNSLDKEEIYLSEVTNLTLKNMPTLKRLLFTPNNEYEEFDINNVINGKNYKVTTFNNPNMKEFITTADNRLSYTHRSKVIRTIDYIEGDGTAYLNTKYTPKSNTKIVLDVQMDYTKQYAHWLGCERTNKIQWDSNNALLNNNVWTITPNANLTTRQTYTITASQSINEMLVFCGYNNSNVLEDNYIGKGKIYSMKIYEGDTLAHDYIPAMNGDIATLYDKIDNTYLEVVGTLSPGYKIIYPDITPNTVFSANTLDLSDTQFTDIKLLCTTDLYNLKVPTTMKNFYCDSAMDIDTNVIEEASYEVIHDELIEQYTTDYSSEVFRYRTKNLTDGNFTKNTGKMIPVDGGEPQISTDEYGFWTTSSGWNNNQWISDFIQIRENTECSITKTGSYSANCAIAFCGEDKKIISYYRSESPTSVITFTKTSPVGARYVVFGGSNNTLNYDISFDEAYTPNIIPSSASGSLIFNLYSNNTTQPTSTSPYMWDLTGLKLNDFYTFGMNNWVKPNDGAVISVATEKVTIFPKQSWRGSLGNTVSIGTDNGASFGALSPLKVKQGDSIKVNIQQSFKYAIIDSQGIILAETTNTGAWSSIDTVVEITQENADRLLIQAYPTGLPVSEVYFNDITFYTNTLTLTGNATDNKTTAFSLVVESMNGKNQLVNLESITMPQRLPGYSIRMVNADITPNNYANHLYPLLVDTTLPITGKLDYSKYQGTSLAWAYAYTTNDVTRLPLDSRHIGQITNEYNKLYSTDFVDIVDVWAYKDDDFTSKTTNENITKAYIELTSSNYTTRIDEVLQWYPNCTDLYLFDDGSVTILNYMYSNGNNNNGHDTRKQVQNVTFMEGYFNNLVSLMNAFTSCINLVTVSNIPKTVTNIKNCFENCNKFNCQLDFSEFNIANDNLQGTFFNNYALTYPPILPSNYTGNMGSCFQNCSSLVEAPVIPDGVNDLSLTFNACTSLTTVGNIPSSCDKFYQTFRGCNKLTSVPINGWRGYLARVFNECTSLNQQINISSANNLDYAFMKCTSLSITPTLPDTANCTMQSCFQGCTSLTTAPTIPNGVTNLNTTFFGCSSLTIAPNIPDGVTSMDSTFNSCINLESVNIPSSVETMDSTFRNCEKLKNIAVNGNLDVLTKINSLYRHCLAIETVYIPLKSVVNTFDNVLTDTTALRDIVWLGERSSDFNVTALNGNIPQSDIKELVNEHLGTVESATLTLGETYGAYLSPDEVFLANRKGWTIEGASNDFTIVNASDDVSGLTRDENITGCVIELTSSNYRTRIDEVLQWYPNCTDVYLFEDGSVTNLNSMFGSNNTNTRGQIVNVTFMEGYFNNPIALTTAFKSCVNLVTVNNVPKTVTNIRYCFEGCQKLNCQFDFSEFNIDANSLQTVFVNNRELTYPPILPSNYTGSMQSCFQGCSSLVEAPVIPDGVTNLNDCFNGCSSLVEAPVIPDGVTTMRGTFEKCTSLTTIGNIPSNCNDYYHFAYNCTSLTSVPTDGWHGFMHETFYDCTSLNQQINITSDATRNSLEFTFKGCSSLSITPTLPSTANCSMQSCFQGCTSLVTPPVTPEGVTNMDSCYMGCSNLTGKAIVPNSVTTFPNCFKDCSKLNSITFPLDSIGTGLSYDETLMRCNSLTDIEWTGLRTTNFSLLALYAPPFTQADVKELVNEHLGTVESATLTLGATNLAYLTEEEIASATAKGWTLQ